MTTRNIKGKFLVILLCIKVIDKNYALMYYVVNTIIQERKEENEWHGN